MKGYILIIDDNPTDLKVVSKSLERVGYACHAVSNEVEGFLWLKTNTPRMIFLDLNLAGTSGYEVIKTLKGNKETAKIPIVVISGKNQVEDVRLAIRTGGSDYIVKPLDPLIIQEKAAYIGTSSDESYQSADVPLGKLAYGFIQKPILIEKINEFGIRGRSFSRVEPGDTIEIGGLPADQYGTDRILLRCLSVDLTQDGQYSMQFTFVGILDANRQMIRKLCRALWAQQRSQKLTA